MLTTGFQQLDLTPASEDIEDEDSIDTEFPTNAFPAASSPTPAATAAIQSSPPLQRPSHTRTSITSLPPELILEIVSYLHPVDRICLGLTSKSLLRSTLPTLRITPFDWIRFHDRRYSYILPQMPALYVRLAHGWVPKDKFRYCNRCYKILPRNPEYFKLRLCKKRTPRYHSGAVGASVSEKQWRGMSKKARYAHLVDDWCHSPREDSSLFFCVHCLQRDHRNWASCSVHCPLCLERDLTWKPPRKPWFRKFVWKWCKNLSLPFELLVCWLLLSVVWLVKFCYVRGEKAWNVCAGWWRDRGNS